MIDSRAGYETVLSFIDTFIPSLKNSVELYEGTEPIFDAYDLEGDISRTLKKKVWLKSGGYIVIEHTEALVAIDVNSGKYRSQQSAEQTAYKINTEAANEIARQLRLRDLGGLIICDFIDMRSEKHRRDIEKTFRTAVKVDRARSRILRMSSFGIVEMTRQRMRPSLQSSTYLACPDCGGTGFIKSHESLVIEIIRLLNLTASKEQIKRIELFLSPEVADYLQNEKRAMVARIEQISDKSIIIHSTPAYTGEKHEMVCYNERGRVVKL